MKTPSIAPISVGLLLVGLAFAVSGHWRGGLDIFGLTMVGSGVGRLLLPRMRVGALAVRSRVFDAAILIGAGVGLLVLVAIVPTP